MNERSRPGASTATVSPVACSGSTTMSSPSPKSASWSSTQRPKWSSPTAPDQPRRHPRLDQRERRVGARAADAQVHPVDERRRPGQRDVEHGRQEEVHLDAPDDGDRAHASDFRVVLLAGEGVDPQAAELRDVLHQQLHGEDLQDRVGLRRGSRRPCRSWPRSRRSRRASARAAARARRRTAPRRSRRDRLHRAVQVLPRLVLGGGQQQRLAGEQRGLAGRARRPGRRRRRRAC